MTDQTFHQGGSHFGSTITAGDGSDIKIGNYIYNVISNPDGKCLADLYMTNPPHDKKRIETDKGGLLHDSYNWILGHHDFQRWRDNSDSRLLWIKGDPGKGKTMLLIGIVKELEQQVAQLNQEQPASHAPLLAYFFCQGTDARLNNATAVLRGLIYHLVTQQHSLISHLRTKYDHAGSKLFEGCNAFVALSDIMGSMLQDLSVKGGAYIVIDALDECESGLQHLLQLIIRCMSISRIKWIISSRNRRDMERELKFTDSQIKLSLELKANAQHISHAVGVYIDDQLSRLELFDNRDTVRRILRQKAGDTFLWAALVIKELRKVEGWDILDVLEEIPAGLEGLYDQMAEQIQRLGKKNPKHCWQILSAALLAYRPLHILEMGVLSGLPKNISSKAENMQSIITMCGSFLGVRDDLVYLVHQSAKDYLSEKARSSIFPSGHKEAHHIIFLRSLQVLSETLRRDIYGLQYPGTCIDDIDNSNHAKIPDPDPLAPVRYACFYWADHLCDAGPQDALARANLTDDGVVHVFLKRCFMYWIEALSLCKAMAQGVSAMAKIRALVKVSIIPR